MKEFTLKINGKEKVFTKKVSLLDLVEGKKEDYIVAKVNNRLRELTYEIDYDAQIKFLTLKDEEAIKTYETSIRYLVAMACKRVYPKINISFSYNVSRSIFLQVIDSDLYLDTTVMAKIENEMKKIVAQNIPLNRRIVTKAEAEKIYLENNYLDKLEILKYRPEETVHLYDCDGYLNYMFGYMVPSTAWLSKFKLRLYFPGMIIQYPRAECKGEIPTFEDDGTFGKTLKQSATWGHIVGADSIGNINKFISDGKVIEFVNICETHHNNMLAELGEKILAEKDTIRLICIAGPSSSGKTTFANRLRIELLSKGVKPIRISIDDYYLSREQITPEADGSIDLEAINALDVDLFNQNMLQLIGGEKVQLPRFDFSVGKRVPGRIIQISHDQPIIIEGIHALNDDLTTLIPKHQKFKIFIAPQAQINIDNHTPISLTELRLLRRIVRDKKFRNASAENTMSMWPSVRAGEFKWIYPNQEGADYVFNSLLSYELCVMKKYALPVLREIDSDSQYFILANRLIKFLKYFDDIDDKWVPNNSLLREFIGDSVFQDV